MKLYIHCGYHKTGSSFIQMMLSRNREFLKEEGFYYPVSDYDKASLTGKISPGNGLELSQALVEGHHDFTKAFNILQNWIQEATKNKCNNLIISNEGLFHSLANIDFSLFFQKAIAKFDLEEVGLLLFLRDPLDHIISLYKHRGKRGTLPNFKNWVEQKYETLQLMEQFFDRVPTNSEVNYSFRKYKNNSQYMSEVIFKDWIKVPSPPIPTKDRVNNSLSLSEIMVLENVYKLLGPEKVLETQKKFMANSKPKPNEDNLKNHYAYQIKKFLKSHVSLIDKINKAMPEREYLIIESSNESVPQDYLKCAQLSNDQLKIIIRESSLTTKLKEILLKQMKTVYRKLRK